MNIKKLIAIVLATTCMSSYAATLTPIQLLNPVGSTNGQVLTSSGASTAPTWTTLSVGGSVTSASVVTANGFAGTIATPTTTPAITISTGITGLLKGNGTAISAATSGTDYGPATSALATGILKSTTTTGAHTIATGADLPVMTATVGGAVPTPPNNTTTYLRGDGTFASPAGSGDMVLSSVQTVTGAKTFGTIGGTVGKFILAGSTSGSSTIDAAAVAGTTAFTLPTTSDTLVGKASTDTLTNKTLTNATITNYVETAYVPSAGSAFTVSLANGTLQQLATNANVTITLPTPVAGKSYTIQVAYGGVHTVTWAGGGTIKWAGGSAPAATSVNAKFDVYSCFSVDTTNTFCSDGGRNY